MTALVADTMQTPSVSLDRIHDHPLNPRRNAVADESMVESIRRQGVLDPVMLAPRADGDFDLIDGHRRRNGAEQAGLTEIPAHVRDDLVTDAQKLEVMVITGLQKALLSPVEEAAAYEQLELAGIDAEAIAREVGISAARVRSRMKLNNLSSEARERVHAGDASLVDVAELDEFADDPAALAELEEALGTPNFRQRLYQVRGQRERAARNAVMVAEFVEARAVLVQPVPGTPGSVYRPDEPGTEIRARAIIHLPPDLQDPAEHDGCLGYTVPVVEDLYSTPRLLCLNPSSHPAAVATKPAPVESDWEKQRAEREAARAQRAAAARVRLDWLAEHFAAMFPARSHGDLVKAARAGLPLLLIDGRDVPDSDTLTAALSMPTAKSYAEQADNTAAYAATLGTAKPAAVLDGFARYLAALLGEQLDTDPMNLEDPTEAQYLLGVWDWMKAAGYVLSDVDVEVRTQLEVRHTELASDAEAS